MTILPKAIHRSIAILIEILRTSHTLKKIQNAYIEVLKTKNRKKMNKINTADCIT
jgi:RNase P/RNase MRP subunit POP5